MVSSGRGFHCPKFLVETLNIFQPLPSADIDWSLIKKNSGPSMLMSCSSIGEGSTDINWYHP